MLLPTIVEDYALAAVKGARFERIEEGIMAASVPQIPGLLAFGANAEECLLDLYRRLQRWIGTSFHEHRMLPVIEGIDLNTEDARSLANYHPAIPEQSDTQFFANEEEFEAALDSWENGRP